MRNLTITLTSEDGKLQVSESTGWPEGYPPSEPWVAVIIKDLAHRLDVLERDGPWNNGEPSQGKEGPAIFHERVVQNSLRPAPETHNP